MTPVCGKCIFEMRCAKNDVPVQFPSGSVHLGDFYYCEGCGASVLTGFGRIPVDIGEAKKLLVKQITAKLKEGKVWRNE